MLYLITGANGAGKTLNALKWVRERQLKESRPVAYNGRFDMVEGGELKDWKKIDAKDWQQEPDGTIFLFDECQYDFPALPAGAPRPPHVAALTEHRKRGFDFYLITQHPGLIDTHVRRLIGPPGWHRHLKRPFGGSLVSVAEYSAVNERAEKPGASRQGEVKMVPFPREVFKWYTSASMHTGKKRIPRQVWFFLACLAIVPLLIWFGLGTMRSFTASGEPQQQSASPVNMYGQTMPPQSGTTRISPADYALTYVPRIPNFPHTAPRYDQVTQPVTAPRVAACIAMSGRCNCYTQQGTLLQTEHEACMQIVRHGHFEDWDINQGQRTAADKDTRQQPM